MNHHLLLFMLAFVAAPPTDVVTFVAAFETTSLSFFAHNNNHLIMNNNYRLTVPTIEAMPQKTRGRRQGVKTTTTTKVNSNERSALSTSLFSSAAASVVTKPTTATTTIDGIKTKNNVVKNVFVCTGNLCSCQEEGESADDILQAILTQQQNEGVHKNSNSHDHSILSSSSSSSSSSSYHNNHAYTVEETTCLGQCGSKAVVAIDYDDGSNEVILGKEKVLQTLGIFNKDKHAVSIPLSKKKKIKVEDLATQRMREEALDDNDAQKTNPWFNAATYLAKKATESIFSSST